MSIADMSLTRQSGMDYNPNLANGLQHRNRMLEITDMKHWNH